MDIGNTHSAQDGPLHPQSIFAIAHTDLRLMPFNNHGRTLRLVVESNVSARALRIRFSNACGEDMLPVGATSLALCNKEGELYPDTLIPVTVAGGLAFELMPGEEIYSDLVEFPLSPGDFLALNLYYPTSERVISGNWMGQGSHRSRPGNYSADLSLAAPGLVSRFARTVITSDITVQITSVAEITAYSPAPGRVVACFGDSITQQSNWTAPFEKRLHHKYPGKISLCNLGISGNRLLHDACGLFGKQEGLSGLSRFDRDVLSLSGLTHCIIALGTNDIGLPGSNNVPESEMITVEEYITGLTVLADKLHARGCKAYIATLTPRVLNKPFDLHREEMRHEMNGWIRSNSVFDAVLDFDRVLAREDGEFGMQEGCALPDGLHPSAFGGILMAKSIDLSLFGGDVP